MFTMLPDDKSITNYGRGCFVVRKKSLLILGIVIIFMAYLLMFREKSKESPVLHIILITIDTLRADHLGCYGYPRATSPFIDSLAASGTLFEKAFASISTTAPSHASIFTSLYPIQHNVLKNGHRLSDSFLTIAEFLGEKGFTTAGFVSTDKHFKAGNIGQGIELFDEPLLDENSKYRRATKTVDAAVQWLDERKAKDKFFLWVHLFDPHEPYHSPPQFLDIFTKESPEKRKDIEEFLIYQHHVDYEFYENSSEKMLQTVDAYDGEVLFADTEVARLVSFLEQKEINNNTLIVLTSDHGEGLGNHKLLGHGKHIYNEQIHVPLIFYFSDGSFKGRVVQDVVEHIDIVPTIIELLQAQEAGLPFEGVSLVPLLSGNAKTVQSRFAFAQRREYDNRDLKKINAFDGKRYEAGNKFALQNTAYKYIYRSHDEDEFYALSKDPYEVHNIVSSGTEQEYKLKKMLRSKIEHLSKINTTEPESVDDETIKKLRSLGYIQ